MPAPKRFSFRTVAIPVILMLVHALVISTVSDVYASVYPLLSRLASAAHLGNWPAYSSVDLLVITEYPRIAVLAAMILIPLYLIILFFRRLNDPQALWVRRTSWAQIWPSLAIATGLLGVTNLIFAGLTALSEQIPAVHAAMSDYLATAEAFSPAIGYGWLTLGIAVLAPVSEELLFRGIIQGELRRAMPEKWAIVIQAVLFALFHGQPVQIAYVLLPALALGALYAITRSIWIPIIVHIAFNFLGSVIPAAVGSDETLLQIVSLTELAFIVIGFLALIALVLRERERER